MMLKKELAQALGISASMVTKLSKRGMPVDTLERAQKWRKRHLESARVKGVRFDANVKLTAPALTPPPSAAMTKAISVLELAALSLVDGQSIDALVPALRAAMQAVPNNERAAMLLPVNVMDLLTTDVGALLPPETDQATDGDADECNGGGMSDAEAARMGEFWYQVAAGEWRAN